MHKISIILTDITKQAGTERAVVNLANIFISLGYSVRILSTDSETGISPYSLKSEVEIIHLGLRIATAKGFSKINEYKKLKQKIGLIIKSENVDCLIGTYSLFNALITKIHGVKTIGCEHFNYESAPKVHRLIRRFFYPKLDAVVVLTERDKKHYVFLKNACVIPNSLSFTPRTFSSCRNKKMISLGRLTKQKGYDLLIDSMSMIKDEITDWSVEIFGAGEDKESLEHKIHENGLEDILSIKPPVSDVESVYSSSSIYLSSSRYEGLQMTLLEAQSCGVPCIVFDCPCGPAEIVEDNKTGFVVPLGDRKYFAKKILELVENERMRIEFGKNAAIEAGRFSSESVAEKWENLLAKLSGEVC
ncbi:MAG: glycosyltransferase family 4 protein [Treponema sp.]|nr:glycosyltransferase family 4 protein [Treponema sp.]